MGGDFGNDFSSDFDTTTGVSMEIIRFLVGNIATSIVR